MFPLFPKETNEQIAAFGAKVAENFEKQTDAQVRAAVALETIADKLEMLCAYADAQTPLNTVTKKGGKKS
jgi:hypothetical protein